MTGVSLVGSPGAKIRGGGGLASGTQDYSRHRLYKYAKKERGWCRNKSCNEDEY